LMYSIQFENEATATAPAQQVVITDPLDQQTMDLATFALGPISFGDITVPMLPGVTHFTGGVDLRPAQNVLVVVEANLDAQNATVTWRFTSVDPDTLQLTTDPAAGFLPPDTDPPAGEGSVLFTIDPKSGLATGTQITNQATVVFDTNAGIDTPTFVNAIDVTPPVSAVTTATPTQPAGTLTITWSGSDQGSGIRDFTIFASVDGGPFSPGRSMSRRPATRLLDSADTRTASTASPATMLAMLRRRRPALRSSRRHAPKTRDSCRQMTPWQSVKLRWRRELPSSGRQSLHAIGQASRRRL
jgi:hypothetical protein